MKEKKNCLLNLSALPGARILSQKQILRNFPGLRLIFQFFQESKFPLSPFHFQVFKIDSPYCLHTFPIT